MWEPNPTDFEFMDDLKREFRTGRSQNTCHNRKITRKFRHAERNPAEASAARPNVGLA